MFWAGIITCPWVAELHFMWEAIAGRARRYAPSPETKDPSGFGLTDYMTDIDSGQWVKYSDYKIACDEIARLYKLVDSLGHSRNPVAA